jgi:hypothetical protein
MLHELQWIYGAHPEAVMAKRPNAAEPLLRALAEYAREAEAQRPARLGQLEAWEPADLLAAAELLRAGAARISQRLLGVAEDDPDLASMGRAVDRLINTLDAERFAMLLRTEDTEAVLALLVFHLDLGAVEREIARRARASRHVGGRPHP